MCVSVCVSRRVYVCEGVCVCEFLHLVCVQVCVCAGVCVPVCVGVCVHVPV